LNIYQYINTSEQFFSCDMKRLLTL